MEHLVESHMGGIYISDLDPEVITEYCEECCDNDWIVSSWDKNNEQEKYEVLSNYFCLKQIANQQELENMIRSYTISGVSSRKTVTEIIHNSVYEADTNKDIVKDLFERSDITEEMKNNLIDAINDSLNNLLTFIKTFDYSLINFNEIDKEFQRKRD